MPSLNELRAVQCLEAFLPHRKQSLNVTDIVIVTICIPSLSLALMVPTFSRLVDVWYLRHTHRHTHTLRERGRGKKTKVKGIVEKNI